MKDNIFIKIVGVILIALFADMCVFQNDKELGLIGTQSKSLSNFAEPSKSPFNHNVGVCFSVEETVWFNDNSIKYSNSLKDKYTYERLNVISKDFKLIRIYSFLVSGWEQTGDICPEAYSLVKVTKQDKNIEAVIGTSCNKSWFLIPSNVDMFIDTLKSKFGSSISQVKTILIGNEINANSYSQSDVSTIMSNFKSSLKKYKLNIPVTATFSNLPNQSGDAYSDSLVSAIVNNWDTTWNGNKPFVFIDPYPDAAGIGNAKGIYNWQYGVTNYYNTLFPNLQIFIGETGGEGCDSDYKTTVVIDSIFSQLNYQYDSIGKTVPTFLFESVNEHLKLGEPNQKFMGLYFDSSNPKKTNVSLKTGINFPKWFK